MNTIHDVDARVQTILEVTPQEDGTVLLSIAKGNTVMVNVADLLIAAQAQIPTVPDLFMAVEYDETLDSYVACCSGKMHNTSGEAIQEYKSWGRCGVANIARRHDGMWYIGDVYHDKIVV